MTELEPNCKGYFLYRLGIDQTEQYRNLVKVYELFPWFNIISSLDEANGIAVVRGQKNALQILKINHKIEHMIVAEGNDLYSHREDTGMPVRYGSSAKLLEKYQLSDLGVFYPIFLRLKK
jgi:hypothetical protein